MVLIAVAVMLGLWALYSMTSGDDDSTVASESKQENSTGSTIGAAPESSAGPDAAGSRAPGASEGASAPAPHRRPHQVKAMLQATRPLPALPMSEPRPGDAAAGEENAHSAARDRNDIKVSVLNNSGEVDKAKKEADSLKGGGFKVATWATCLAMSSPSQRPPSSSQKAIPPLKHWLRRSPPATRLMLPR